jgi:hypothetical protein
MKISRGLYAVNFDDERSLDEAVKCVANLVSFSDLFYFDETESRQLTSAKGDSLHS